MTIRLVSNEKIAETSSKGNQEKWLEQGHWYKLDQFGYYAPRDRGLIADRVCAAVLLRQQEL